MGSARERLTRDARLAALAIALGVGCASPFSRPRGEPNQGPYDRATPAEWSRLAGARAKFDSGDVAAASAIAKELAAEVPNNIGFAVVAQEFELAVETDPTAGLARLRDAARLEADKVPSAAHCVLAARLESDSAQARAELHRALELDGQCAWAHYGVAHLEARSGNWAAADEALIRALAIDPFHPQARRMQAGVLARNGRPKDAVLAFESWLEDSVDDPRIGARERLTSELDLATLYVLVHKSDKSRELLAHVNASGADAVRALCILAAADQDGDRARDALAAAQEAQAIDPHASLPWVQEATLRQNWLDDPKGAAEVWKRLVRESESGDLSAVLLGMRARLALERAAEALKP